MKKVFSLLPVIFLLAISCSTDKGIQQILGISAEAPVFLDCRPVSATEIVFKFSTSVRVVTFNIDPAMEALSIEDGQEVRITFDRPLEEGKKFTADILVEDPDRNSLNVIVPFRGRNSRMPALLFNELRTEYTKPKVEFVEFYAPEAGNLGAIRLFIAGYSLLKPVYEFPPAEVKAGEYIVLHLRSIEEGIADETGSNLALSLGTEALSDARDFWLPGSSKLFHKTDALWLLDQDDRIIDAVLLSENPGAAWGSKETAIASAAEYLAREKAWLPPSGESAGQWLPTPSDAVITSGSTLTRTICRDESLAPERRAAAWYITATSSTTPGKPNNPKRYQ